MGVFGRLLGRSKAAQDATAAEERVGTGPDETEVAETVRTVGAERPAEDAQEPAEADAAGSGAAEGAEIPKQQSAADAPDRETGEGARA